METTHNSVKVKLGIKVMKLVESLIGREVTVGQGSECKTYAWYMDRIVDANFSNIAELPDYHY